VTLIGLQPINTFFEAKAVAERLGLSLKYLYEKGRFLNDE